VRRFCARHPPPDTVMVVLVVAFNLLLWVTAGLLFSYWL